MENIGGGIMKQVWTFEVYYEMSNGRKGCMEVRPLKIDSAIKFLHDKGCINIVPTRKYYNRNIIHVSLPSDMILGR